MTTDLWMLVWSAVLCALMPFVYLPSRITTPGGLTWGFGNREERLRFPERANRAARAHAYRVASLAPFAILVLVAHVAGKANAMTALGATLFFWGRVAHVAVYVAGIIYVRTLAFAVAFTGELLIFLQLFR